MANKIQLKRSSVSGKVPTTTDLDLGELALNTNDGKLYTKKSDGTTETVVQLSVDSTVVKTTDSGTVTSAMIADGTIVNGDVSASAAIAGSKISPDFGAQTITTTGVVSAAAGAAATPSIAFTGDLNTGIYSPGADQLALSTNGTGRLFIDASGNVGIGAPSSITGLELSENIQIKYSGVNSEPGGARYLTFNNTDTTLVNDQPLGGISWVNNDADATAGQAAFVKAYTQNNTGAAYLTFGTGSQNAATEHLRITSAGLVGIGTSAPGATLTVSGGPSVDGSMFPSGNLIASFGSNAGDAGLITFGNQSLNASTFTMAFVPRRAGSVGAQHGWYQKIDSTSAAAGSYTLGTLQRASSGGAPETPRFHITSAGLVGIGTTTPTHLLTVNATLATQRTAGIGGPGEAYSTGPSASTNFSPAGTQLTIDSGSSITDNASLIHFGVRTGSGNSTGAYFGAVAGTASNGPAHLVFGRRTATSTWAETARIDNSGRLLVGTSTAPAGSTAGSITATNSIFTSGNVHGQYAGDGTLTGTTGTAVFKFKITATNNNRACFVKLSVFGRANSTTVTNSPAAEYAFQLHMNSSNVMTLNGVTSIFEYTFVRATHFAFANLGSGEGTVTITNPVALSLSLGYKVEILNAPASGTFYLNSVTYT